MDLQVTRLSFDNDEDSGLGMEFEDYINSQDECFELSPMTAYDVFVDEDREERCDVLQYLGDDNEKDNNNLSEMKRKFEDNTETNFKRPRCLQNHRTITKQNHRTITKALSFEDEPRYLNPVDLAVDRSLDNDDLIADGSSHYKLPTVKGKHSDLKSISPETMRKLILGRYHHVVDSFCVVDCRYPFEYQGGHIQGAVNLHTKDMVTQFLHNNVSLNRPDILIFHCEFSSERGPKLCRFLRNLDRQMNCEQYPALYYPEIYILDGGYKEFFYSSKEFCLPRNYIPMLHEDFTSEVRHFRSKSKSWSAGQKRRSPNRLF